jgi:hypothetical protein
MKRIAIVTLLLLVAACSSAPYGDGASGPAPEGGGPQLGNAPTNPSSTGK